MSIIHGILQFFGSILGPIIHIVKGLIFAAQSKWMLYDTHVDAVAGVAINPLIHASQQCPNNCAGSTAYTIPFALIYLAATYIPGMIFAYEFTKRVIGKSEIVAIGVALGYKALTTGLKVFILHKPGPLTVIHNIQTRPVVGINTVVYLYHTDKILLTGALGISLLLVVALYVVFRVSLYFAWIATTFSNEPWFTSQRGSNPGQTIKRYAGWLTFVCCFFLLIQGDAGLALVSTIMAFGIIIMRRSDVPNQVTGTTKNTLPPKVQETLEIIADAHTDDEGVPRNPNKSDGKSKPKKKGPPAKNIDWNK